MLQISTMKFFQQLHDSRPQGNAVAVKSASVIGVAVLEGVRSRKEALQRAADAFQLDIVKIPAIELSPAEFLDGKRGARPVSHSLQRDLFGRVVEGDFQNSMGFFFARENYSAPPTTCHAQRSEPALKVRQHIHVFEGFHGTSSMQLPCGFFQFPMLFRAGYSVVQPFPIRIFAFQTGQIPQGLQGSGGRSFSSRRTLFSEVGNLRVFQRRHAEILFWYEKLLTSTSSTFVNHISASGKTSSSLKISWAKHSADGRKARAAAFRVTPAVPFIHQY